MVLSGILGLVTATSCEWVTTLVWDAVGSRLRLQSKETNPQNDMGEHPLLRRQSVLLRTGRHKPCKTALLLATKADGIKIIKPSPQKCN